MPFFVAESVSLETGLLLCELHSEEVKSDGVTPSVSISSWLLTFWY